VTGYSEALTSPPIPDQRRPVYTDYVTIAYQAATGSPLWEARYGGPPPSSDYGRALAMSPDGTKVFVTGGSGGRWGSAVVTVAYYAT
jgi:hypothetical protein